MSTHALLPVGRTERFLVALLLAAMGIQTVYLLPFWTESPELSHAFFTVPLSLWLLARSRDEADAFPRSVRIFLFWAALAAALVLIPVAGMAALAQGIGHSQTAALATLGFAAFMAGSLIALSCARTPFIRFNGAGLCATALWLFASPLPSGTLSRLTVFLQDKVAAVSLGGLHFLGIPAVRHGNILELAQQMVGVEEACSGIRSLIACLFAGAFLGGYFLRGIGSRAALIVGAGVLAIAANFIRSFFLCLMAARGTDITVGWHDATAYAILGCTVAILYGICTHFAADRKTSSARLPSPTPEAAPIFAKLQIAVACLAAGIALFVLWRTRPAPDAARHPAPDLAALLDMDAPGWRHTTNPDIARFAEALNTRFLREESYVNGDTLVTFYMAYWPSGQSTLGSVGLHTPDMCLPGAGWTAEPAPPPIADYPLSAPRRFRFVKDTYPLNVWFWHYYGGHPVRELPGLYPWQLAPYLLKRPVSSSASQWVLRVASNRPLETLVGDPLLKTFFARLDAAGLVR